MVLRGAQSGMIGEGFKEDVETVLGLYGQNQRGFREKVLSGHLRWDRYKEVRVSISTYEEGRKRI